MGELMSPLALYYSHTCPHRLHAFILGTLQCVDKSTYESLMAHKIMSHTTIMSNTLKTSSFRKGSWLHGLENRICPSRIRKMDHLNINQFQNAVHTFQKRSPTRKHIYSDFSSSCLIHLFKL